MSYRLFTAIDIPCGIREAMGELCDGLEKVRWTPSEQLHLTLRFIGETDGALTRRICSQLSSVRFSPFELSLRGTGHFPLRGEPKVLWVGVAPSRELTGLYRKIDSALEQCGIAREGRKFSPHITVGRLRGEPVGAVGSWLSGTASFRIEPFSVDSFHLYSSRLNPDGAIHEKLASF